MNRLLHILKDAFRRWAQDRREPPGHWGPSGLPGGIMEEYARILASSANFSGGIPERIKQLEGMSGASGERALKIVGFRPITRDRPSPPPPRGLDLPEALSSDGANVLPLSPTFRPYLVLRRELNTLQREATVADGLVEEIGRARSSLLAAESEGQLSKRMRRRMLAELAVRRIELQFTRMTGQPPSHEPAPAPARCAGITKAGVRCKRPASRADGTCHQHRA